MGKILYQLKAQLNGSDPLVWRRFQVLGNTTLDQLHDVFQIVMGWDSEHHYQFILDDHYYSSDALGSSRKRSDASQFLLGQLIKRGKTPLIYEYDLSDGWEHDVMVEKIRPISELDAQQLPVCLEGENATPPENSGGMFGYYELLSILKDPQHQAYQEMLDTYGDLNPAAFDLGQINRSLQIMFHQKV